MSLMEDSDKEKMVEKWLRNVKAPDVTKFQEQHKSWRMLEKLAGLKEVREEANRRADRLVELEGGQETLERLEALYQEFVDIVENGMEQVDAVREEVAPAIEKRRIAHVILGRKSPLTEPTETERLKNFIDSNKN